MPSTVTKVFLSSTTKDLKPYREAVARAVNKMSGYHCVGMEGFGARPERPAEVCIKEVVVCDLLVGIVGPLYGSSPPDNTKSFTEIEYEAALDKNIAPLMYVTPDDFPIAANLAEPEDRRRRQQDFRSRVLTMLTADRSFKTPDELASLVVTDITNWERRKEEEERKREEEGERGEQPNPASYIPYKCDRQHQEATFLMFLRSSSQTRPNFPQFYFVHGEERENHRSFVERLCRKNIQEYAETRWKKQGAKVAKFDAEWPQPDEPAARQELLKSFLFDKLAPDWPYRDDAEYSAQALRGLLVASLNSVVVFQHEIQARDWDGATADLLRWYLEFWDEVKGNSALPQCFVFVNIVYPQLPHGPLRALRRWNPLGLRSRVMRAVRGICESRVRAPVRSAVRCPSVLLPELPCVSKDDLTTWFRENQPRASEAEREAEVAKILADRRRQHDGCLNMRDVEPHLTKFHQKSISYTPGVK